MGHNYDLHLFLLLTEFVVFAVDMSGEIKSYNFDLLGFYFIRKGTLVDIV